MEVCSICNCCSLDERGQCVSGCRRHAETAVEVETVVEGLRMLPRTLLDWVGMTDQERSDALGRYAEALDGLQALLSRIPEED